MKKVLAFSALVGAAAAEKSSGVRLLDAATNTQGTIGFTTGGGLEFKATKCVDRSNFCGRYKRTDCTVDLSSPVTSSVRITGLTGKDGFINLHTDGTLAFKTSGCVNPADAGQEQFDEPTAGIKLRGAGANAYIAMDGANMLFTSKEGFTVNGDGIEPVCECANGDAHTDQCMAHGSEKCKACNKGYHLEDDKCQPWKTCAAGSGQSKEGTSTSDRECESCTVGAFFSTTNDGSACEAVRTCPAGSGMSKEGTASSDRECEACRLGYFFSNTNDGSACEAVRAPCPAGERIWAAATTSSNLECRPCGSGQFSDAPMQDQCNDWKKCASGKGEINTPSADTDRECGGCELGKTFSDALDGSACRETDECAGNEYEKVAATTESDRACATHAAECASHEYQTQAPDGTQDRECAKKVCHCPNGVFADGDECPKHGDPMCLSCTGAFHLADANKQCQANTCYCVHGSVAFGSDCTTNGAAKCMDCNEGYHMEGENCVITPINGGWSDWSTPGACSVTACGQTGTRTKTRTCSNPAKANGGLDCVGSANDDSTACATAACPTTTTTTTTTTTPCAMVQCQAGWNLVGADERGCGGTCWFSTPDDLSTGQPCQASSETHGTTCALALNGDTRRDHPFQLHTAKGDQWVRVLLKASTTNPKVTFYARNCCSSNTGPTMRMFIGATDNLSAATDCGKITGIADSTTNVATCTGTGKFVWLRTDGAKTLQVPEFKVEGVPAMLIA